MACTLQLHNAKHTTATLHIDSFFANTHDFPRLVGLVLSWRGFRQRECIPDFDGLI